MSIRKVSDLETVSFTDGTQQLSDVNDSLIEVSFPHHGDGGHSYKSMKTRYEDIRTNLLSSVFSSDMPTVFEQNTTFRKKVEVLSGLDVSGDLCVNVDNPAWQNSNVYVRAGDITLYGSKSVNIKSDGYIGLSADNVYTYANTAYFNGFSNPAQQIAEFNKARCKLYAPLESICPVRVPTATPDDSSAAVNVAYLSGEISALKEWVNSRTDPDTDTEDFELIGTELYTNDDILNVKYLLQKKYKYTYKVEDADGNQTTNTKMFVEYEIKSMPTQYGDKDNKNIYFPDVLVNDTLAITTSETTNMTRPSTSNVQATRVSLISMGSSDPLTGYITGLTMGTVARSESLNAHIFAEIPNFEPDNAEKVLFPRKEMAMYNFNGKPGLNSPRYTFSTPRFLTYGHAKFMVTVNGRLGLSGVTNSTNIYMHAVCMPDTISDDVCLYSGYDGSKEGGWPGPERIRPQWREGKDGEKVLIPVEGIEVTQRDKTVRKYISDANNGYFVRGGVSNKVRNETILSYPERYVRMYTPGRNPSGDNSYNTSLADLADAGNYPKGRLITKINKQVTVNNAYFKLIGKERVRASGGAFQFTKSFSMSRTGKDNAKSMRVVFSVDRSKPDQSILVNDDLMIRVVYLD